MVLLAGPTAVGKSEIALLLAQKLGGEIVSVDSMQVYRGLDIGTAKPSAADRERVPHHLIDIRDLRETFDAAQFLEAAKHAVREIEGRGRVPIFCGGTGLYFKVFLGGLAPAPAADPALRAQLRTVPLADLLRELAQRDPVCYERIDRQNPRRVIRAIEVIRLTGRPFSEQRTMWPHALRAPGSLAGAEPNAANAAPLLGLSRSPGDLQRRIDSRVNDMFRRGLVAETESLLARGLAENPIAMQALGYHQVVEHLRGTRSLDETIQLVKIRTRQFAKRQMTWFRRQLAVRWFHVEETETPGAVVDRLLRELRVPAR